ncbi:MAG: aspartate--tRNA ligase [Candidatus Niyogibacteria bacterium]|nr:aspartate--tRNA ligase [Candidatus Niyogibacteria bacterium]
MPSRILIKEIINKIGEKVVLSGWVDVRRDHGKIIFLDLRDMSGKVQMVVTPKDEETYKIATTLRPEWVVEIEGLVSARPEKMKNPELATGGVEMQVGKIKVLAEAETPPIDVSGDGYDIGEDTRLQYRYVDLKRARLQKNLRNRHKATKLMRDFLAESGFVEIETPILTKSTPEGARDYIVPSRLHLGTFYALPQSPQQYKQLLMAAGFERYFQMARCFRDEDTRGDRQPEFTQMDLEMSFVDMDAVMSLNEKMVINMIKEAYPNKKIQEIPFPRLSYKEVMNKYGTDRPDLRKDINDPDLLAFCWVVDFPFFSALGGEKTETGGWTFTHNPFSAPKPEFMDDLMEKRDIGSIITTQYDVALNGYEIGGGSIRNHKPEALKKVFEILGYSEDRIEKNFGHMLQAFKYGTPPHGGIAFGLDRLIMLLEGEGSIREVMAFPKTGDGRDFMMSAPSEVEKEQLIELGIKIEKSE